jgi:hypothetical protein
MFVVMDGVLSDKAVPGPITAESQEREFCSAAFVMQRDWEFAINTLRNRPNSSSRLQN